MTPIKWEYKNLMIKGDNIPKVLTEKNLNDYGDQGWELVTVIPCSNESTRTSLYLFKRPVSLSDSQSLRNAWHWYEVT